MTDDELPTNQTETPPVAAERYTFWVDRVGAFLVCVGNRVTIGGPASEGRRADVSLLANLSRKHATFVRSGERYLLEAHAPTTVAGRPVHERVDLNEGNDVTLGTAVKLRFRLPNAMSGTARIEFLSDHRPNRSADGVVLMHDTCLLGPGAENHILCPGWPQPVLVYRRGNELWCKSREELFIDGQHAPAGGALRAGSVVSGNEIRFRLEGAP